MPSERPGGRRTAPARHVACGLAIASNAPICGLPPADGDAVADVEVEMHAGAALPAPRDVDPAAYTSPERDEHGEPLLVVRRSRLGGARWLRYSEGACFRVDALGTHVDAWWRSPLTEADAATYLLGPVLGFVMRLRGTVPLHASGVTIGGRAVLFVGDAGAGKSTTAAAFASLGYPVLSDDIVPLAVTPDGVLACPGYPRVSIWGDAAEALFGHADALPSVSAAYDKRVLDLERHGLRFQPAALPIGTVFVLDPPLADGSAGPVVRDLGAREGLLALVANTYCSYLLDQAMRAREFDVLGRLAAEVAVRAIAFGGDVRRLPGGCAVVAGDLTAAVAAPWRPGASARQAS